MAAITPDDLAKYIEWLQGVNGPGVAFAMSMAALYGLRSNRDASVIPTSAEGWENHNLGGGEVSSSSRVG